MLVSLSTLAVVACQGCGTGNLQSDAVAADKADAASQIELIGSPANEAAPGLQATSQFSLTQSQTTTTPSLSIAPVDGQEMMNATVEIERDFSDLRLSNSPSIVNFERARTSTSIASPVRPVRAFDASLALSAGTAQTGLGFDVGVVPRMSIRKDGQFETRSFGGEIRIGQNFDQRGEAVEAKSWYLFAGADGEALVYEPDRQRDFTDRMALRDQVTVGDMQAGVSFTRGSGQVSFSYIRREVEYNERGIRGQEETEDFAGVSFTLRR